MEKKKSSLPSIGRKCEICKKKFLISRDRSRQRPGRFCTQECRNAYFAGFMQNKKCIICSKKFRDRKNGLAKFCGLKCYWKCLKDIHVMEGYKKYITLRVGGKKVYEHRIVMEVFLKRKLKTKEIVHHKNGDTTDNRIENLEIMSQSDHIKEHLISAYKKRFIKL